MSIEKVYYELSKGLDDEYYVELASKNVMLVPVLIDLLRASTVLLKSQNPCLKKSVKNIRL